MKLKLTRLFTSSKKAKKQQLEEEERQASSVNAASLSAEQELDREDEEEFEEQEEEEEERGRSSLRQEGGGGRDDFQQVQDNNHHNNSFEEEEEEGSFSNSIISDDDDQDFIVKTPAFTLNNNSTPLNTASFKVNARTSSEQYQSNRHSMLEYNNNMLLPITTRDNQERDLHRLNKDLIRRHSLASQRSGIEAVEPITLDFSSSMEFEGMGNSKITAEQRQTMDLTTRIKQLLDQGKDGREREHDEDEDADEEDENTMPLRSNLHSHQNTEEEERELTKKRNAFTQPINVEIVKGHGKYYESTLAISTLKTVGANRNSSDGSGASEDGHNTNRSEPKSPGEDALHSMNDMLDDVDNFISEMEEQQSSSGRRSMDQQPLASTTFGRLDSVVKSVRSLEAFSSSGLDKSSFNVDPKRNSWFAGKWAAQRADAAPFSNTLETSRMQERLKAKVMEKAATIKGMSSNSSLSGNRNSVEFASMRKSMESAKEAAEVIDSVKEVPAAEVPSIGTETAEASVSENIIEESVTIEDLPLIVTSVVPAQEPVSVILSPELAEDLEHKSEPEEEAIASNDFSTLPVEEISNEQIARTVMNDSIIHSSAASLKSHAASIEFPSPMIDNNQLQLPVQPHHQLSLKPSMDSVALEIFFQKLDVAKPPELVDDVFLPIYKHLAKLEAGGIEMNREALKNLIDSVAALKAASSKGGEENEDDENYSPALFRVLTQSFSSSLQRNKATVRKELNVVTKNTSEFGEDNLDSQLIPIAEVLTPSSSIQSSPRSLQRRLTRSTSIPHQPRRSFQGSLERSSSLRIVSNSAGLQDSTLTLSGGVADGAKSEVGFNSRPVSHIDLKFDEQRGNMPSLLRKSHVFSRTEHSQILADIELQQEVIIEKKKKRRNLFQKVAASIEKIFNKNK